MRALVTSFSVEKGVRVCSVRNFASTVCLATHYSMSAVGKGRSLLWVDSTYSNCSEAGIVERPWWRWHERHAKAADDQSFASYVSYGSPGLKFRPTMVGTGCWLR